MRDFDWFDFSNQKTASGPTKLVEQPEVVPIVEPSTIPSA